MTLIEEKGPAIKVANVNYLETLLGAKLDEHYREFLLLNNGGRPSDNIIDVVGAPEMPTDVQIFFGINRNIRSSNLDWNLELILKRFGDRALLPIACDSGGSLFCLQIERGVTSKVVYCDLDRERLSIYSVASTFDQFLVKLRHL